MIPLNKYILLESQNNKNDYIRVKFTDDDIKRLSIKEFVRGTRVRGYKFKNFSNYGYCEFEKTNKNEWTFVSYTDGIAINDSAWKDAKSKEKYTNSELEDFIKNRKDKKDMLYASVPTKLLSGDFAGVEKYYNNWDEDMYAASSREFFIYSFEKKIKNIDKEYDGWNYVSVLHMRGEDKVTFRYVIKKGLYVIFKMTEDEMEQAFKKCNIDINKIKHHEYLERW